MKRINIDHPDAIKEAVLALADNKVILLHPSLQVSSRHKDFHQKQQTLELRHHHVEMFPLRPHSPHLL